MRLGAMNPVEWLIYAATCRFVVASDWLSWETEDAAKEIILQTETEARTSDSL